MRKPIQSTCNLTQMSLLFVRLKVSISNVNHETSTVLPNFISYRDLLNRKPVVDGVDIRTTCYSAITSLSQMSYVRKVLCR